MSVFEDLTDLSPAIQAAAATVAFFHPEYCSAEPLVADITLWCMDHGILEDVREMELFGEKVWWFMAVGIKLVKAGMNEYESHITGVHSVS